MGVLEGLLEQVGSLVIPILENTAWAQIPEHVKPKLCTLIAAASTEIEAKIAASETSLDNAVWREIKEDAIAHFEAANGQGAWEKLDKYVHV